MIGWSAFEDADLVSAAGAEIGSAKSDDSTAGDEDSFSRLLKNVFDGS
jgi:hypothetical protein